MIVSAGGVSVVDLVAVVPSRDKEDRHVRRGAFATQRGYDVAGAASTEPLADNEQRRRLLTAEFHSLVEAGKALHRQTVAKRLG